VNDRDELHLLSGAHSLDAVDGAERERFEEYLETSEDARTEVASLTDTAVLLGLASTPVAPSEEFKARLMARVAVTPQLPALVQPEEDGSEQSTEGETTGHEFVRPGSAEARAQARWYRRPATALIAAAAAIAIFAGGAMLGLNRPADEQQQQAASFSEISAADDMQSAEASIAGGGEATLMWSAELKRSAVVVDELPEPPSGMTYQLWYIDKESADPAGTFVPTGNGKTIHVLDGVMKAGDIVGITIEPAGGSTKPSGAPIVTIASV